MNDRDRIYFGSGRDESDSIGFLDEKTRAIFGRSYAAEPDKLVEQLKQDEAIAFLRSVVRASPGNTDAKLLLAQLLGMKGDLAGSRQAFQSAL